jgi:hypothetical protein
MRYLSFSLWGDNPIYNVGVIRNAELWKDIYPEWKMIVYYDDSVPTETIKNLLLLGVETVKMNNEYFGCFWRFLIASQENCEYAIFRDCDSRISIREKEAVDEWINSGKVLHIMRDHPAHRIPYGCNSLGILAGMWGIKGNTIDFYRLISNYCKGKKNNYGIDQSFLTIIYDGYKYDSHTNDDFFSDNPFPSNRKNERFVGERIDENDNPLTDDYKILLK